MKTTGNTMLITGGGSGIGRELARRFHDLGNTVIVAGRRKEALQATIEERERMHFRVLDIDNVHAIDETVDELVSSFPRLNVLVNNAGIMRLERLTTRRDLRDAEEMVITNLLGPIRLTNALIDHLTRQRDAAIVNVTSGLAFVPLTAAPSYSATKAALHTYSVALRSQLKDSVEVIEVIPPAVQTELTPGQSTRDGYMPLHDFIEETMLLLGQQPSPSEIIVERVRELRFAEREDRFDAVLEFLDGRVNADSLNR